jgi:PAS domain-containing protein
LQRAAEARLKERLATRQLETEANPRRLQHEVEVHQIELETQNEELRRAQMELAKAMEWCRDLYDFAPMAYLPLRLVGTIQQANFAAASLRGTERAQLVRRRFAGFVVAEALPAFRALLTGAFQTEAPQWGMVGLSITGKPPHTVHLQVCVKGGPQACRVVLTDFTERTRADEAFRLSQQRLSLLIEQTLLAAIEFDTAGRVREWNTVADVLNKEFLEQVVKEKLGNCFEGATIQYGVSYTYPKLGERKVYARALSGVLGQLLPGHRISRTVG